MKTTLMFLQKHSLIHIHRLNSIWHRVNVFTDQQKAKSIENEVVQMLEIRVRYYFISVFLYLYVALSLSVSSRAFLSLFWLIGVVSPSHSLIDNSQTFTLMRRCRLQTNEHIKLFIFSSISVWMIKWVRKEKSRNKSYLFIRLLFISIACLPNVISDNSGISEIHESKKNYDKWQFLNNLLFQWSRGLQLNTVDWNVIVWPN